ncbi:MAG: FAD-binding oxidoreductase [Dehalococcoidia bacterium]|nr:FAD-binding oxidoreductase [Dehalococcoidia bacterium]MDP6226101.1 FAD-binding oxidoreductase [Dehalococcoidia bacterium]MDP7083074.1 FAD-binding oxidoreductase [Dehalococcoidia bacterium]MDP7200489.1 FAD-binding oxidoreductase [Dehalococcoidia bacterium]MDP7510831.1 FAD-binding oxidoreductase [Dehalococcoidia bacterium]
MLDSLTTQSLADIVGQANLLTGPYDLDRYSADALTPFRAFGAEGAFDRLADAVVRPNSTKEVSEIVALAVRQQTPLVPYGGGTGVMGGTIPVRGGIIVDLGRMNRVLSINPTDLTAEVEAGLVLQDLEEKLAERGLMPGHDPYSLPIATVGGAISTNGVGYRAAAHGPMGQQVVALEVVLPDGRVMATRPVPKYSSGPNLNHLFIGAEGVFGIITKATVQVYRVPEAQAFVSASFDSFDQGFAAAAELLALGIRPALFDLTEEDDGIQLFLLFEGFREGVAAQEQRSMQVCLGFEGRATGSGPTLAYWKDRHQSGLTYKSTALGLPRQVRWDRMGQHAFDYLHLSLPISKVLEYRRRCGEIMAGSGVRVTEYSIWSRPELFSMLLVAEPGAGGGFRDNLARVVEHVLSLAQDMGGVMEYCHGVGVKLNHLLAREMGVGHDVLKALKQTLDPANIMNPGKLGL